MFYRYSLLYEEELCTPFIKITHAIYIDFSDSCDPNLNGTCGFAGTCSGIPKSCICKPGFYGTWCSGTCKLIDLAF